MQATVRSLTRTLQVRFTLTMLVALSLITAWAYLGVRKQLAIQLDRSLESGAQLEDAVLDTGMLLPAAGGPLVLPDFIRQVNRFVVVRDSTGRTVSLNTELARELPLTPQAFTRARAGQGMVVTETWNGQTIRSVYRPVPAGSRNEYVVLQLAASAQPLDIEARGILWRMLATMVLGTLATAVGSRWLAVRIARPVAEIARQARTVHGGRTGQRITVHADLAEYQGLLEVLNEMVARLERAVQHQRRIVTDVGHELRTPLTAMRGEVEIALRGDRPAERYRKVLGSLLEEIDRLIAIERASSLLLKLEGGGVLPRFEPVDLAAVAGGVLRGMAMDGRLVEIQAGEPAFLNADRAILQTVVEQLLDNVMRHTLPGTGARVSVRLEGRMALLVVEDAGPGVAAADLPNLFEPMYRGDPARGRGAGAGLGLTVVAAAVHLHGGEVIAGRSELGGLRISITLPLDPPSPPGETEGPPRI